MGFVKEFKEFATKGNVIDMGVGIIIGGAFGLFRSSLVNDVLMPPLGLLIGGVDFTDLKVTIKEKTLDAAGNAVAEVTLNYGNFIQTMVDFTLVAFAIFLLIKAINRIRRKQEQKEVIQPAPPQPSKEEILLTEIRDLLRKK